MISKVRWPWSRAPPKAWAWRRRAASGASVVLADIDGDLGAKEAEQIVLEGGTAIGIACDVADEAQVAAMGTAPTAVPRTKR
jgi:enoyl-ACP reductase-like protein